MDSIVMKIRGTVIERAVAAGCEMLNGKTLRSADGHRQVELNGPAGVVLSGFNKTGQEIDPFAFNARNDDIMEWLVGGRTPLRARGLQGARKRHGLRPTAPRRAPVAVAEPAKLPVAAESPRSLLDAAFPPVAPGLMDSSRAIADLAEATAALASGPSARAAAREKLVDALQRVSAALAAVSREG